MSEKKDKIQEIKKNHLPELMNMRVYSMFLWGYVDYTKTRRFVIENGIPSYWDGRKEYFSKSMTLKRISQLLGV